MTAELSILNSDLAGSFFRYAHISGAMEAYMEILISRDLQKTFTKFTSGSEREWEQIHRSMVVEGVNLKWYPELPVQSIITQKEPLFSFLYGVTLGRMIEDLDFYFSSLLRNFYKCVETGSEPWTILSQKAGIDLLACKHGTFVVKLLQERHKIEHCKSQVDRSFLTRLVREHIGHVYAKGDAIQKRHIDIVLIQQVIREFAADVDSALMMVRSR